MSQDYIGAVASVSFGFAGVSSLYLNNFKCNCLHFFLIFKRLAEIFSYSKFHEDFVTFRFSKVITIQLFTLFPIHL